MQSLELDCAIQSLRIYVDSVKLGANGGGGRSALHSLSETLAHCGLFGLHRVQLSDVIARARVFPATHSLATCLLAIRSLCRQSAIHSLCVGCLAIHSHHVFMCVVVLYALACSLFVSDKIALLAISDTLALCQLLSDTLASCVYVFGRVVCVCICV